jgi:hypothetical protein
MEAFRRDLEFEVNRIWIQANVEFNMETEIELTRVRYDFNDDKKLAYPDSAENATEYRAISAPYRNSMNIHVFYVRYIGEIKHPDGNIHQPLDFFVNAPGESHIFISDEGRGRSITVLAHELGHALGLDHNSEHDLTSKFEFDTNDPDRHDNTSLMWREDGFTNTHIGSPFWKRLNEMRCYPGDWNRNFISDGCKRHQDYTNTPY